MIVLLNNHFNIHAILMNLFHTELQWQKDL